MTVALQILLNKPKVHSTCSIKSCSKTSEKKLKIRKKTLHKVIQAAALIKRSIPPKIIPQDLNRLSLKTWKRVYSRG